MAAKDELGRAGESAATAYLTAQDHEVLDRNWRCGEGEIDAVTLHRGAVVIVEVKTRKSMAFGDPLSAVDSRKLARLWRLAREWVHSHPDIARGRHVRVDVVGLTGNSEDGFVVAHLEDVR